MLLFETLTEVIKTVGRNKHEVGYRDESNVLSFLFHSPDHYVSDARIRVTDSFNHLFLLRESISSEYFMYETKPVVTENFVFEK